VSPVTEIEPATVAASVRHDLAVVVVSHNDLEWLEPCLSTVLSRAGEISFEVIVVDNSLSAGARDFVRSSFPQARAMACENHGFAHANNVGLLSSSARYVLFLNPDTELLDGTLAELVAAMDARPEVGLAGVRQLTADGRVYPTIRYFPTFSRALGEALGSERWPIRPAWSGERELDMSLYDREVPCDWTTGAFMLVRREALLGAGLLDERLFLQSEEPDLCRRIKLGGWEVRHIPVMTIVHHAGKGGVAPRMTAQSAFARRQYADKHFSRPYRHLYVGACMLNHLIRALPLRRGGAAKRRAARLALKTLSGRSGAPFEPSPRTAIRG